MADRKRTGTDWEDVRVFLALARHGSLSAAARALAVNHATVARRLRSLEASLGERLVERRADGYVLTAAGTRILDGASDMERAARTLGRGTVDGTPSGLVRVNAPPGLAAGFLTARLAEMTSRHPELDVDLATDLRPVSLERHETDIAIRMGRPEDGDVIARRGVAVHYGFYGTEEAWRRVEAGEEPRFVGFDEANASMPETAWLLRHRPGARLAFRASHHGAQAVAARSGVGIALLPHYIGRGEPRLRLGDLGPVPAPRETFVLTRSRDRKDFAVQAVADAVVRMFADERPLFE